MKIKIVFFAVLLLVGSLVATDAAASEDVLSNEVVGYIQASDEKPAGASALRRLASALSSGREAMRPFRGAQSENNDSKDRLNPPVAGLECYIDRIASYVSCYSSPIDTEEEAETLFTRLVDELQAALPSDRWKGMKKEPGMPSVRSYTYDDQESNAHIDIDIIAQPGLGAQSSYIVSIFGWTH